MEQLYSHVVDWRELYRAAQLETNIPELFKLVEISEASLLLRRDELKAAEASGDELWEIERALQNLIIIKRERLYFRGQVELDCKKFTSPDSDRKKQMIESLREMLEILSESPQEAMYCERCGLPLGRVKTHFWLEGTQDAWEVLLPYCQNCHPEFSSQKTFVA